MVQLVCLPIERYSIDYWDFNFPKLEHIDIYVFIGIDRFSSYFLGDRVSLTLERLA